MTTTEKPGARYVVVGVDESPQSVAALRWAAAYAANSAAELRLVHAFTLEPSEMYGSTAGLRDEIKRDARAKLTEMATGALGSSPEAGKWRLDVVEGHAGPVLVELSQQADLLVLGTREHTGLRRLVSGSVSHHCLSHAHGPVVAVPMSAQPPAVPRQSESVAPASASR
jgi:nucleotide-binding universal stress UspA family protein